MDENKHDIFHTIEDGVAKGVAAITDMATKYTTNGSDGAYSGSGAERNDEQLTAIVKIHARNASIAAAASSFIPATGPTVAAALSAGFVLSLLHKINERLEVKLSKDEMKPVADSIVHTVTPMAITKYLAASGLSCIPVAGNIAAGTIMASVCYSITYASGMAYLQALRKLKDDEGEITADNLRKAAKDTVQQSDMVQVFEGAMQSYGADQTQDSEQ